MLNLTLFLAAVNHKKHHNIFTLLKKSVLNKRASKLEWGWSGVGVGVFMYYINYFCQCKVGKICLVTPTLTPISLQFLGGGVNHWKLLVL